MSNVSRILPEDSCWMDRRLTNIYHNEFAYSADPAKDLVEWRERRDFTRSQVILAAGLNPMPDKMPIDAKIWGHTKHEGTVIAKVRFESMPGLICTGNLYMPERVGDQAPGILCPHGHWTKGRVHHEERGSIPTRCMMLARLGFIVFSYDMLGYNDNNEIMHTWPVELLREAALSGVTPFGLQTWNSLRALDFLCALPNVDERRIGCTGASGGASQTWTVSLLDERIKVLAPVCMLSSHYQGGCTCEEGPLLRLNGVTSFDVLSACAPRPLLLPAVTQDWTNLNPSYEVQALRKVYALFGAEDALKSFQLDAPHNYNHDTRERVYPWFTHWLLNQSLRETIVEDELQMPPLNVLLHNEPPTPATIVSTKEHIQKISAHLCKNALPDIETVSNPMAFRAERINLVGEIVNNDQNLKNVVMRVTCPQWEMEEGCVQGCLISRRDVGDVIPAVNVVPNKPQADKPACLLLSTIGKNEYLAGGNSSTVLDMLVSNGCFCLLPDLMGSGETADMPSKSYRQEEKLRFFAFNPSLFSMRVQDILTCIKLLSELGHKKISLIATGDAVKPALAALAICKEVHSAVLDMDGQSDEDAAWLPLLDYQPMIKKIGGMKGLAALANVSSLGLFKPENELEKYVSAFSAKLKIPENVYTGIDTFLRMIEYIVCKNN